MARCVKIRKHLCVGASSGLTAKQDSASATTSSPQGSAHDSLYQGEWKRVALDPWNIMTHNDNNVQLNLELILFTKFENNLVVLLRDFIVLAPELSLNWEF